LRYRFVLYFALVMLLGGCTGMSMDSGGFRLGGGFHTDDHTDEAVETAYRDRISLVTINASLIVDQARAQQHTHTKSPLSASLMSAASQPAYEYRVGPQDVLQVTVWDHPELTTPAGQFRTAADTGNLVRQDGTIFYPYIGIVPVAGKTLEQVRQLLAKKLSKYIRNPQVDVRVAAFRSQKVYVSGEVAKPGMQPITDAPLYVLDAIQAAGGVQNTGQAATAADLEHVKLNRDGTVHVINVLAMLHDGDLSANIRLRDGDVLHVPDNFNNKVFVMGEVKNPASTLIHNGRMTLAEALGDVGGVDMATSNPGQIYVIRGGDLTAAAYTADQPGELAASFKPVIYRLDADSPDALILADQFDLHAHDVVFVSTAEIVRWGRLLNQLQGTIQSIAVIRALSR